MTRRDVARRQRGSIDRLPSGAYRVRVAAGIDPVTGKRHTLVELAGTAAEAEKLRTRLLAQVDERRNPRTKADINALFDRYLDVIDVGPGTKRSYESYINNYIRPALGSLAVEALDGEHLDRFYAQLRICRARCRGRGGVDHRTTRAHDCDGRCRPHECRPLGTSAIRQLHWLLSGALVRAMRWRWIAVNPMDLTEPPPAAPARPQPPTYAEAARIVDAAMAEDLLWGALVWLVMTTGMRRGEVCALRRRDVDLESGVITVAHSKSTMAAVGVKDTKTHQQRRIAIEPQTVDIVRRHLAEQDEVAGRMGERVAPTAFVFSYSPAAEAPIHPDSVSHRYRRTVSDLGISTTLHKLRHYNATELIAAGVDPRTVAGRLGHGGGGTTTLKVYAAWVSEADQRASRVLAGRLPAPRIGPSESTALQNSVPGRADVQEGSVAQSGGA